MVTRQDYDAHRERTRARQAAVSRAGRSIGALPSPKNPRRRKRALEDLETFFGEYFPEAFYLPPSEAHRQSAADIQRTITQTEMLCEAMPRGWGKSTRFERATLWAGLRGASRFCVIIGASEEAAIECLDSIKVELETNDRLCEDFPEVCLPIRALERITNRAKGQTYQGQPTFIKWEQGKIILPTIPGGAGSGFVIRVSGIEGRVRGMKEALPGGRIIRPDLALLDDPQTDKAARSPAEVAKRLRLINGAILRLAGPNRRVAAMASVTVIQQGDLADQLLDRKANPQWHGRRYRTVEQFPEDPEKPGNFDPKWWNLVQQYRDARAVGMNADDDGKAANRFYRKHRRKLEAGVVVNWKHKIEPGDLSAVQSAVNWLIDDEESFFAEGQNAPKPQQIAQTSYSAGDILGKILKLPRGTAPSSTQLITAFVDVQKAYLPYMVTAWSEGFAGHILEYGTYPEQKGEPYFQRRTAKYTIDSTYPGQPRNEQLYAALKVLTNRLLDTAYPIDTESQRAMTTMGVDLILIDAGFDWDVVNQFCRESRNTRIMPSRGDGLKPSDTPIPERTAKEGQRLGHHWMIYVPQTRSVKHLFFDTNRWKSITAEGLLAPLGATNAITIHHASRAVHRVLLDHLTAEYPEPTEAKGRTLDQWYLKPNRENDLFDGLVGCAAAASVRGLSALGHKPTQRTPRRRPATIDGRIPQRTPGAPPRLRRPPTR